MLVGMRIQTLDSKPSQTYERGRVCAEEECKQILSVYNPNEYCWMHAEAQQQAWLAQEYKSRKKVCTKCRRRLTLDDFHLDSKNPDGHRAQCKSCRRIADALRRSHRYKETPLEVKPLEDHHLETVVQMRTSERGKRVRILYPDGKVGKGVLR